MDEIGFSGFPLPTKNFFLTPNELIDIAAHITNLSELKVILYILRHTWGYQEYGISKAITTDEFMKGRKRIDNTRIDIGTGLSNSSVIEGLRRAVKHEYLECETDDTDKARIVKKYKLKMHSAVAMDNSNSSYGQSPQLNEISYGQSPQPAMDNSNSSYGQSPQRSEKDTKERHPEKDTNNALIAASAMDASSPQDKEAVEEVTAPGKTLAQMIEHPLADNHPAKPQNPLEKMIDELTKEQAAIHQMYQSSNPAARKNVSNLRYSQKKIEFYLQAINDYLSSPDEPSTVEMQNHAKDLIATCEPTKKYPKGYYKQYYPQLWNLAETRTNYLVSLNPQKASQSSSSPQVTPAGMTQQEAEQLAAMIKQDMDKAGFLGSKSVIEVTNDGVSRRLTLVFGNDRTAMKHLSDWSIAFKEIKEDMEYRKNNQRKAN